MSNSGTCPNYEILKQLESSFDRLNEAEWHIRKMEEHYHQADQYRWSLNSFLRALKEVLQLVTMEVQHHEELREWYKEERKSISQDPIVGFLFKQRDIVVHKARLKPASKGTVGFTKGRGIKLGIGMPINPLEDSETAMLHYIWYAAKESDFLGILYTEEDGGGEYSCVEREWRMDEFPDEEIIDLAARAWEKVAAVLGSVGSKLGAQVKAPALKLHNPNMVRVQVYNPEWIRENLEQAKAYYEEKHNQ